jgi:hypothetical protein
MTTGDVEAGVGWTERGDLGIKAEDSNRELSQFLGFQIDDK